MNLEGHRHSDGSNSIQIKVENRKMCQWKEKSEQWLPLDGWERRMTGKEHGRLAGADSVLRLDRTLGYKCVPWSLPVHKYMQMTLICAVYNL